EHVGGNVEHLDQGQILEYGSHASAPGVGGTAERDVVTGDPDLTVVLVVDAADDLDERGLAGAVVAEDGQHLPGVGGQVDADLRGEVVHHAEHVADLALLLDRGRDAGDGGALPGEQDVRLRVRGKQLFGHVHGLRRVAAVEGGRHHLHVGGQVALERVDDHVA